MKHNRIFGLVGAALALAAIAPLPSMAGDGSCEGCAASQVAIQQVKLQDLKAIAAGKKKGVIVDSRASHQYRAGHIPRAISLPIDEKMDGKLPKDRNTLVVFYCGGASCPLSTTAAERAVEMGYQQVAVYKGGWTGWRQTASR
jgi:rhodanese-related sulfurtransferase